jgi:hypothetical protein
VCVHIILIESAVLVEILVAYREIVTSPFEKRQLWMDGHRRDPIPIPDGPSEAVTTLQVRYGSIRYAEHPGAGWLGFRLLWNVFVVKRKRL